MKTDVKLKHALAKALPDLIRLGESQYLKGVPIWIEENAVIEDTEWLLVCWLIEESFIHRPAELQMLYFIALRDIVYKTKHSGISIELAMAHASWLQRAEALERINLI